MFKISFINLVTGEFVSSMQHPFCDTYIVERIFDFVNVDDYENFACVNSVTFDYFTKKFSSQVFLTSVVIYVSENFFIIVANNVCQIVSKLYLPRILWAHIINSQINIPFIRLNCSNFRNVVYLCLENVPMLTGDFCDLIETCKCLYELRLTNCDKFAVSPNIRESNLKILRIFNDVKLHYSQQSFFRILQHFKWLEIFDTNNIVFIYDHPAQYFVNLLLYRQEIKVAIQTIFHPQLFVDIFTAHWQKVTIIFYILGEPFQLFTSGEICMQKMNIPVTPAQYFEVVGRQIQYNNVIGFSNVYAKRSIFPTSCMCVGKSFLDDNIYVSINQALHNVPENIDEIWLAMRSFDISELSKYKRLSRIVDINCNSSYKHTNLIGKLRALTLARYHDNINIDLNDLASILSHNKLQSLEIISPSIFQLEHTHIDFSQPTENLRSIESLPTLPISSNISYVHIPIELFKLNQHMWLRMYRPGHTKLTISFKRNDTEFLKIAREIEHFHKLRICGFDTSTYLNSFNSLLNK